MKNDFHFVYIPVSEVDDARRYTGLTQNLDAGLKAHNLRLVRQTAKYRP